MTKKVLILAIGCNEPPWGVMHETAKKTWNSVQVDSVETIHYFGHPVKPNTDTEIYWDVPEAYNEMGHKLLKSLKWCLDNKGFDYVCRINSSTYIQKQNLLDYVQGLPDENVFEGAIVKAGGQYNFDYCWGALPLIWSKDVVRRLVYNSKDYNHSLIEDVAISKLAADIDIPFRDGKGCSIDKVGADWRCLQYGMGESFTFNVWNDIKKSHPQFAYRVKYDLDRTVDKFLMERLYENL